MSVVSMRELLEAGVHFGHQTKRWNPKMNRFIFSKRNGIHIIDIQQTIGMLEQSYNFVRDSVAKGGTILFVGTKKQAQEAIEQQALRVDMPYINYRWLGGMLTNFETIKTRLVRLKELEDMETSGKMDLLPKKEVITLDREREKLERNLGGIRGMTKLPAAVWIVDTVKEHIAVKEANRLGIPVVAVVDTNCDPDEIQYVIPGNDDAIRSGALLTRLIADACADGYQLRAARSKDDVVAEQAAAAAAAAQAPAARAQTAEEPLAEWEIALQQEEAARQAAQASGAGVPTEGAQAQPAAADQAPSQPPPTAAPAPTAEPPQGAETPQGGQSARPETEEPADEAPGPDTEEPAAEDPDAEEPAAEEPASEAAASEPAASEQTEQRAGS